MVESITECNSLTEGFKPEPKKVSLTKTIRFSESEIDLWENWNKDVVKKVKAFLREQLTYKQAIRGQLNRSNDPTSEKARLMREKMDLVRYLRRKGASKEKIDQLYQEYNDIYYAKL